PRLASCHGIRIRWSAGEFDENYPFHKHSGKARKRLSYDIVSLSPPRARSYKCRGTILSHEDACSECRSAQVDVDIFNHQAQRPWRRVIPYTNLSYAQQRSRARALQKQLDSKVLEARNASLSLKNAQKRIEQYKQLLDYSGTHLVPGLHRIFANALKQHWGAKKFFTYLVKAVNGEYHARNYSQMDIDLAVILY
ncbi:hypothetical protein GGF50DRAFT_23485, partial [Schizophyllum commune]